MAASLEGLGVNEHLTLEVRFANRLEALTAARDWIFENTASLDAGEDTGEKAGANGKPAAA